MQLDFILDRTGKQSLGLILELLRSEKLTTYLSIFLQYKIGPFQKYSASGDGRLDSDTLVFCCRNLLKLHSRGQKLLASLKQDAYLLELGLLFWHIQL